jgi:hypothetical protein
MTATRRLGSLPFSWGRRACRRCCIRLQGSSWTNRRRNYDIPPAGRELLRGLSELRGMIDCSQIAALRRCLFRIPPVFKQPRTGRGTIDGPLSGAKLPRGDQPGNVRRQPPGDCPLTRAFEVAAGLRSLRARRSTRWANMRNSSGFIRKKKRPPKPAKERHRAREILRDFGGGCSQAASRKRRRPLLTPV